MNYKLLCSVCLLGGTMLFSGSAEAAPASTRASPTPNRATYGGYGASDQGSVGENRLDRIEQRGEYQSSRQAARQEAQELELYASLKGWKATEYEAIADVAKAEHNAKLAQNSGDMEKYYMYKGVAAANMKIAIKARRQAVSVRAQIHEITAPGRLRINPQEADMQPPFGYN